MAFAASASARCPLNNAAACCPGIKSQSGTIRATVRPCLRMRMVSPRSTWTSNSVKCWAMFAAVDSITASRYAVSQDRQDCVSIRFARSRPTKCITPPVRPGRVLTGTAIPRWLSRLGGAGNLGAAGPARFRRLDEVASTLRNIGATSADCARVQESFGSATKSVLAKEYAIAIGRLLRASVSIVRHPVNSFEAGLVASHDLLNEEHRSVAHLFKDTAQVLAKDSKHQQLNAAEEDDREKQAGPALRCPPHVNP